MALLDCLCPLWPLLSWHAHSGGRTPGKLYLPACGASCLWHWRSSGMCGQPFVGNSSRSCLWPSLSGCGKAQNGSVFLFLSRAPYNWPWTQTWNCHHDNEKNMLGLDEFLLLWSCCLYLWGGTSCIAGKVTVEDISIFSLPLWFTELLWTLWQLEACDQAEKHFA